LATPHTIAIASPRWADTERLLGIALTGMLRSREITRDQAAAIARGVLHDNAAKLYGISDVAGRTPIPARYK
jgi:hypothetical protein